MILLCSEKINPKIKEILRKYEITDYSLLNLRCPCCHDNNFIKWGTYTRNVFYIDEIIRYDVITIQRVRCKGCGHTHALLPSFIVPYKLNLLDVILSSLNGDTISNNISLDLVMNWNKQFNKILPYLKTMFNNIPKQEIINKLIDDIFKKFKWFYDVNKKILMMNHLGFYNMAYF